MTRVIIVDDKPENLYLLRVVLEGQGFEVVAARHGAEALALARQAPPHIIVSDLLMPVMDGYTLLRHWKADDRLRPIPFVVYTATYTEPKDEQLALRLGADAFILKPVEPGPFVTRLQEVLAEVDREPVQRPPVTDAAVLFQEYNEILIGKLEDKALQLEQANAALRDSTEQLKRAQQLARVGSWVWHIKDDRTEWSDELYRLFGVDPGQSSGGLPELLARTVHPDDLAAFEANRASLARDKSAPPLEYRLVWPDDSEHVVRAEVGALAHDEAGRPETLIGIVQDVTDRTRASAEIRRSMADLDLSRRALLSLVEDQKRAEAEVRRLNAELEQRVRDRTAQLEEANRELDAFAYSVSHDLRAPLRAINGFAQIIIEDYGSRLDAEGQRLCAVVRAAARDMGQLIDDLLAFSRVGRSSLCRAPVDMTRLAELVYAELTTDDARARVEFKLAPLPDAVVDASLFRQVWTNLLDNALKFSSKQAAPVITVSAAECGGEVVYTVRDNGAGFDMRFADKLFGVFQRLHAAEEFEGTGVGLAIVQRIVHRHGGRVWAEGQPGRGAAFSFTCGGGA
jgi:signal transduction histidine kinase/CheY-like chemotaxis protein